MSHFTGPSHYCWRTLPYYQRPRLEWVAHNPLIVLFWQSIWGMSCKGTALFWKRGRGATAHLHLKRHAQKQPVSASTQNRHFQNDIINILWCILSWNFTDRFWGHLRLILHLVKRGIVPFFYKSNMTLKTMLLAACTVCSEPNAYLCHSHVGLLYEYFKKSYFYGNQQQHMLNLELTLSCITNASGLRCSCTSYNDF